MDSIMVNGKRYSGELIYQSKIEDIDVSLYVLNFIDERYLVIQRKNNIVKDFVVTGIKKVYSIIDLLNINIDIEELEEQVNRKMDFIKEQSYIKTLDKTNSKKFRKLTSEYYDENYHVFTVLGIRFRDLIGATIF